MLSLLKYSTVTFLNELDWYYPEFEVKKSLVLTTSHAFGTNNYVLGLIFVVFGGFALVMVAVTIAFGCLKVI